jgi:single-strand DNA-binding protein
MNTVILNGVLSSVPRRTELPSGDVRWSLEVTTPAGADPDVQDGRAASVPVAWQGELVSGPSCTGDPGGWCAGTELVVVGAVRRRFYRAGGVTQSRTEVVALSLVEVTKRRSAEAALRRGARALGPNSSAALRSALGMLSQA